MNVKFLPKALIVALCLQTFTIAGCALIQLPLAVVGAVLSIVAIPVNLALSLLGPATNAAAAAAPYAMLFAKQNSESQGYDLVIVQPKMGQSPAQCVDKLERTMGRRAVAFFVPDQRENIEEFLTTHRAQCYFART